jgi:hypothetical protein
MRVNLKNHNVIIQKRFEPGQTNTPLREIALETGEVVYVQQFKIPDTHQEEVEKHFPNG